MNAERVAADAGSLTAYVAGFIASTKFSDIPNAVIGLGKKSILDGLGLALAGSVAKSGILVRRHGGKLQRRRSAILFGHGNILDRRGY